MSAPRDFWSRRKQAVEAEANAEQAALQALEQQQLEAAQKQQTDAEILDDLGLQDPDTLEAGDDFSAFMAKAVPTRLRNRALRKLWLSDPALANLDTLLDYGEDFTVSERAIEDIQTAYQVGKGFASRVLDLENKAPVNTPELAGDDVEEPNEQAPDLALELAEEETDDSVVVAYDDEFEVDVPCASKKRMRFVIAAQM